MEEVSIEKVHISLVSDIQTGPDRSKKTRLGLDRKKKTPRKCFKRKKERKKRNEKKGSQTNASLLRAFFRENLPTLWANKVASF